MGFVRNVIISARTYDDQPITVAQSIRKPLGVNAADHGQRWERVDSPPQIALWVGLSSQNGDFHQQKW